jgi:hypothetical protein
MATRDHFAADYADARRRFREAAAAAGARLASFLNPAASGPAGEELTTDIAWSGPVDASAVLVLVAGTHGVEGFCGSGIEVGTLAGRFARTLPPDTALLAIHAINPWGFAWLSRVTEENVDLNRNFVNFSKPLPRNDAYIELADAICPAEWTEAARAAAQARLDAFLADHGAAALQKAITGGQYSHPDGIFFGGAGPSWPRRTLVEIARTHLHKARRVAAIDYHTGLGPWGHGERIVIHRPGSAALDRARQWYGADVTSTALGSSTSSDVVGDLLSGLEEALPQAEFTGLALEYGVLPLRESLDALRADNWLRRRGRVDSEAGRAIKRRIRDTFYGDRDDWKEAVLEQALAAQRQAIAGLVG